jgi:hypothetical protein
MMNTGTTHVLIVMNHIYIIRISILARPGKLGEKL